MRIGINASRAKSGGGIRHMKGIINNISKEFLDNNDVHIWSYPELLNCLKSSKNIIKHKFNFSKSNLSTQLLWEVIILPFLLKKNKIDVLINVDAGSICFFKPFISISRDMLPFEPAITMNFGNVYKLRNQILRITHLNSLNNAIIPVFLTKYAAKTISANLKRKTNYKIIPHGIDETFFLKKTIKYPKNKSSKITITYISDFLPYKNHDKVIKAVDNLIKKGFNLKLQLIGKINSFSKNYIFESIKNNASSKDFITLNKNIEQDEIPKILEKTHIFLFASSCENMPNTLLEGMAAALPIACSNVGSMPEILKNGGLYFNPREEKSIYNALKNLLEDHYLRENLKNKCRELAYNYSWEKCSLATFNCAIEAFDLYQKY